ncbi:MAG: hypothetical protein UV38_C0003G0049 [candidate division TM6 bacterium GW2011_GWE2_42_60]|nr:MAG: hypothetical protein UV38_C0003G0049 [candidate division TM6 bacterium GW2011_GWE2_42_60]HBY05470.1 hypothetical protein [Candidatus Dependentiae bacterium]
MEDRYYAQSHAGVQSFIARVFGWMSFALVLTGGTAYYVYANEALRNMILGSRMGFMVLVLLQLGLVVGLSAAITKIKSSTAITLFLLYAVVTGMTLSSIFVVFKAPSIAATFFVAAGMFAFMAIYGLVTKNDLTSMGSFLFMMLVGIIIASLINMFVQSAAFNLVIAIIGVVVFAGLTAFDIQKIKEFAKYANTEEGPAANIAVLGALQLYLDFINLFLHLLTIMGDRKK